MYTKAYFSQILFTNLSKSVLVSTSPLPRYPSTSQCGTSRCWLDTMIFVQVCLRLATIKWHSKMCSFITEHNVTDVTSFEGACNWHADCRNAVWHFGEVVFFTDESWFSLYRADGRQRVWRRVGEWFAVVNVVVRVAHGGGGGYGMGRHMLWTMNTGAFSDGILNAQMWRDPEAHCCAIHPRPSLHVAAW